MTIGRKRDENAAAAEDLVPSASVHSILSDSAFSNLSPLMITIMVEGIYVRLQDVALLASPESRIYISCVVK